VSSEPEKTSIPPKAIFLLVLIMFAFGSGWPIMKYGVIELPILTFRWLTAILSGVGVLALAACLGQRLRLYREEIAIAFWCGLFNVTGWFYFSGLGLTMLSAGRSTILAYTHPLFAFLIALAMGHDKLAPRRLFGLFCGMCAVVALSAKDFTTFGQVPYGVLAMLAAAACFAAGANLQKRVWRTPSMVLAGWQLLLGGLPLLALALIFDENPYADFTMWGVGAVVYTVLIGNMIGFVLWLKVLELIPAPVATLGLLPVPLVGIASGALILGEAVGWPEGLALLLITAALASTLPLPSWRLLKRR
jgi:drug/metabolite transporter (DMT)-like permease